MPPPGDAMEVSYRERAPLSNKLLSRNAWAGGLFGSIGTSVAVDIQALHSPLPVAEKSSSTGSLCPTVLAFFPCHGLERRYYLLETRLAFTRSRLSAQGVPLHERSGCCRRHLSSWPG